MIRDSLTVNQIFEMKMNDLEAIRTENLINAQRIASTKSRHKTQYWYKLQNLVEQIRLFQSSIGKQD